MGLGRIRPFEPDTSLNTNPDTHALGLMSKLAASSIARLSQLFVCTTRLLWCVFALKHDEQLDLNVPATIPSPDPFPTLLSVATIATTLT